MLKLNLHDSLIEDVNYLPDKKRLEIMIELCNWQQSGHKDTDPEILDICLEFEEVERYEISVENHKFCGDEILQVTESENQTITIAFLTNNDVETIVVTAKQVKYTRMG
jgi:hypothetical protein